MATTKYLYLKQCPGTDAEPGLADGAIGPAQFAHANGALLWDANGGALVVKHTEFGHGISHVEFVADELSTETGVHLRLSGLQGGGHLRLRLAAAKDWSGASIYVGELQYTYRDQSWRRVVRCFAAPRETGDSTWPYSDFPFPRFTRECADPDVKAWLMSHRHRDGPAGAPDLWFLVGNARIPARGTLLRCLPDSALTPIIDGDRGDIPVIGDYSVATVVKFLELCYDACYATSRWAVRREDVGLQVCGVQLESLREIAQLARLAHFWQVFPVLDRLGARVDHAFQSLQRQAAPPSKSLYIAAFALSPQGDTPPELVGEYFWLAFPRFYFGLSEAERAPFAGYAGAMLERFLRRAQNKEDLRHVALALHGLYFSNNN